MRKQKSFYLSSEQAQERWFEVDATDKIVGRLASEIASILRGKRRPTFTPGVDCRDFVIVTNAQKVRLTGRKWEQKKYYRHSGYVGGIKCRTAEEQRNLRPDLIVSHAVKGMLPKTSLGKKQLKKLKVYKGNEHPHGAQNPEKLEL